jgi:hypothetical protein
MLPERLGVILLALALVLPGCGSDDEQPVSGSATATPEATETATATPTPTPTATPTQTPTEQALWPDPSAGDAPTEPIDVARSFAEDYVGLESPALGEFRQHDPDEGEVDVHRRGEDGTEQDAVVAVILLRRQSDRWVITRVTSPEVEIEQPQPGAEITSPVRIAGRGRGFEGNVLLEVRSAFQPAGADPLASTPVTAGAMGDLEPFEAELTFERAAPGEGAILARTGSGIAAANGFAAFPVRFGG